jgi:Zn-dependent protease
MKMLLLLLMTGKLGKLLLTGGSMLLSVFVYAVAFGWRYAVGLVGLIFVHEMGHFIAARNHGLKVGAPVFIPFVGAWVALKTAELDAPTEAHVALAGPVLGSVAAFLCYLVAEQTGSHLWLALAYAGFLLNLFNLIPMMPLDGGRIVKAVSSKLWLFGLPLMAAVFLWQPSPLIVVLMLLSLPEAWAALRGRRPDASSGLPLSMRIKYGATYLGLAAGLAVMAFDTHTRLAAFR